MRRTITIPDDLSDWIKECSAVENRNFNLQLVQLLEEAKQARNQEPLQGVR